MTRLGRDIFSQQVVFRSKKKGIKPDHPEPGAAEVISAFEGGCA